MHAVDLAASTESGLCVVVPADDGRTLCALAQNGRVLVQGLTIDDAATGRVRQSIQSAGLYGVASAIRPLSTKTLPYADNLVNLLIVDADALGPQSPAREEILRVVQPEGVACVKRGGQWEKIIKPRPAEMDSWTHFDHDAGGTGVSHDKLVKPSTAVQWRLELQEYWGLGGNPAAYRPYTGFRLAGENAFFLYSESKVGEKGEKDSNVIFAVGRDAFNGLPIWKTSAVSTGSGTAQEYQFAADADHVYTFIQNEGFPVALDAKSGKVVRTYDKAGKLPARGEKLATAYLMLRAAEGLLFETSRDTFYVLDASTGERKWTYQEKEGYVCFPRVLAKEKRVLLEVVEADAAKIQGRWGNLKSSALLCLDLQNGNVLWRSSDLKDTSLGQLIQSNDRVYAFCPAGIGASDIKSPGGVVACLDARTGKLLWKGPNFNWGYNLIVRDGQPFFATPDALNAVNVDTGVPEAFWKAGYNNRCNRTAATDDWVIMGLGEFIDRQGAATVRGISRSGCARAPSQPMA